MHETMVGQSALWPPVLEAVVLHAHRDRSGYWSVGTAVRMDNQPWGSAAKNSYEGLSTDEMLDVLAATIEGL